MIHLLLVRLRVNWLRVTALVLGVAAATTSFIVLTGQVAEQRLELRGRVSAPDRPSYDILVRPANSRTETERNQALVRPNFLAGQFGGITLRQWREIQRLDGVEVAAPIAMVGYLMQRVEIPIDLTEHLTSDGPQLFTASINRHTARGLSVFDRQDISFSYVTPEPVGLGGTPDDLSMYGVAIVGPDGRRLRLVCPTRPPATGGPFEARNQRNGTCWSRTNGRNGQGFIGLPEGHAGLIVRWNFPFLLAAVDPEQEAKLAGLDRAVTRGRYLPQTWAGVGPDRRTVPVLMAEQAGLDILDEVSIQRLSPAAAAQFGAGLTSAQLDALVEREGGERVPGARITAQGAYQRMLSDRLRSGSPDLLVDSYWTSDPVDYDTEPDGSLRPRPVINPPSVWEAPVNGTGYVAVPPEAADTAFRRLHHHPVLPVAEDQPGAWLRVIGAFDQSRLTEGSTQALGGYRTEPLAPADPASSAHLRGQPLLPDSNFAGYLLPAPTMLTSLEAAALFTDSSVFTDVSDAKPISAIKVRVAGVRGVDPVSRERVRLVAEAVASATGLDVDVTVGSSPTSRRILLPAGSAGSVNRPELLLSEQWQRKGVVVTVLRAVDRKSLLLFVLVLVVCGVFIANAAAAAARSPRMELSTLSCLGWSRGQLMRLLLGEMAVVGASAGLIGALAALAGAQALDVPVSTGRALAAVPAALAVTLLAAAWPVWRASLPTPLPGKSSTGWPRPVRGGGGRGGGSVGGPLRLAYRNLRGDSARTGLAMTAVAVGSAGLTGLLAITVAFRGSVVGSLLGDAISLQARRVDYLAVSITLLLAAIAVADVSYLNIRERREDLALLRAVGWTSSQLGRLITVEGLLIGLAGSGAGALLGLTVTALLAGSVPSSLWLLAGLTALTGTVISVLATLLTALSLPWLVRAPSLTED
ncbi:MAG TPA: ABC transporter permease [Jatrophihabitans sp.]|uniref:ABC transporter permease n=1 Tax=Jatrophihabitans sp. TaxID=1932789 RepID=UPI002EE7F0C5